MRPVKLDLVGRKFGRLIAVKRTANFKRQVRWLCKCDCGIKVVVYAGHLKNGNTKSCGCYQREATSKARRIHGHSRTNSLTYHSWRGMIQRCTDKNAENYDRYGGRGITVCSRWLDSFEIFLSDMGERTDRKLSIDRIKTSGNYEPTNCRWATYKQQAKNRRNHAITTR